jgi:superfamily II DNA helicase RecQ
MLASTPSTQPKPDSRLNALDLGQMSPLLVRSLMNTDGVPLSPSIRNQQNHGLDFKFIAARLKIESIRPLQRSVLSMLIHANPFDTKIIQGPTSMGKDLVPFALAVATGKAQLMFVPYVALIESTIKEGSKFGCRVIKLADIGRSIDLATAAASADIIICSYEHAVRAIRVAQELLARQRLGWCFWNEAHVMILDGDYRDFSTVNEISAHCAQVCCMSATIQPQYTDSLASKLGRTGFSTSMFATFIHLLRYALIYFFINALTHSFFHSFTLTFVHRFLSPKRSGLVITLKVTSDSKSWIAQQLKEQPKHEKAIVFCLFKKVVTETAKFLKGQLEDRQVLECSSGSLEDLHTFRTQNSTVMVCTSVLLAGVSVDSITRVFFVDGAQGPEAVLQGAGRGARAETDTCYAALVTTKSSLQYLQQAKLSGISDMAKFCQKCIDEGLDFSREVCSLFDHPNGSNSVKRKLDVNDDDHSANASQVCDDTGVCTEGT